MQVSSPEVQAAVLQIAYQIVEKSFGTLSSAKTALDVQRQNIAKEVAEVSKMLLETLEKQG